MKKILSITLFGLVLTLTGCLSTIHPIFTEKDLVTDARLIGKWSQGAELDETIEITRATAQDIKELPSLSNVAAKTYMVRTKNRAGEIIESYYAFLVKLGNNHYMDFYPAETPITKGYNAFFTGHYLKMHTCFRMNFTNSNTFQLQQLSESYLKKLIANKKIRIRHEVRDDSTLVVTAPTEELQQYILKYGDAPEAYYESNTTTYNKIN